MTPSKSIKMAICLHLLLLAAATALSVESGHFCGPRLTEMMQILCKSRYASHRYSNQKRSDGVEDNAYIDSDESYPAYPYQFYPFASGFGSTSELGSRFRRDMTAVKRGVIEECCKKSCSLLTLSTYCGV